MVHIANVIRRFQPGEPGTCCTLPLPTGMFNAAASHGRLVEHPTGGKRNPEGALPRPIPMIFYDNGAWDIAFAQSEAEANHSGFQK